MHSSRRSAAAAAAATLFLAWTVGCDGQGKPLNDNAVHQHASPSSGEPSAHTVIPRLRQGHVRPMRPLQTANTGFAQSLAIADGSVWTVGGDDVSAVSRIDPDSGRVTRIELPHTGPWNVVAAGGWVWVSTPDGLFRVDPHDDTVTRANTLATGLVDGFGSLWLGMYDRLLRIDARTGRVVAAIRLANSYNDGGRPAVSVALGAVWWPTQRISAQGDVVTLLRRVDPTTNAIVATARIDGNDVALLAAGHRAWIKTGLDIYDAATPDQATTMLQRFDTTENQLVPDSKIQLVHDGVSAVYGLARGAHLWFPTTTGEGPDVGRLLEFDARTGAIVRAFDLSQGKGCGYNALTFAFGSLWTASGICEQVTRWTIPAP